MVQIAPLLLQVLVAVAQAPPVARNVYSNALAVRQVNTSDLPSQCQSTCQVINTISDCDNSLSCICGSSIGTQLQTCMDCLVTAEPSASTDADSAIDGWNEACGGSLTLASGQTSTSTSAAKSSTATGSSSSSGSSPFVTKTGDAMSMKAIGALGLVVSIACGIIIL
ncbi:uncharacterized protein F5891DRAFT_1046419 [Suillus fuscotomentosus]|uniref:Extracellular membrane protein CFEM domain-containing protein n=1 Tax=Suillus fuscotomentosus TaxID=1912939 RepID=A0AAD4E175_9AGAM|nr:uncharacterized protein F5891DRAFT_1046419 [Suillus fuscotomentosus]KAG1897849.1 hypothetical protein F5891DRAFT_1046419 [Suillus fuscotomentosus]